MFKAAKELRSSLIRNSLKSFVVSPLIKKFQVCAVRAICIGNLSKENIWLQRRKMEKVLEDNEHTVCFFSCITAMVKKKNTKARRRRNDSGSSEEDGEESINNNCGISFWIVFNLPAYGISSFAEHISREILAAEFDLISCKVIRSRRKLTILCLFIVNTATSIVCSIAIYLPLIQVISIFQKFLVNSNKSPLDATAQSLFIVLKDHKSAEAIILTRESYENVVCQAALEQGDVAVTEGIDFSCKPAQLVITKFIDCESKKELLSGLQHVYNTDLHLKVIDLDPNRGILILFILHLTEKVRRSRNIFFFRSLIINLKPISYFQF